MARSIILCVDDDKLVLSALSEQLNEWFGKTYNIEKAAGGEEALMIVDEAKEDGSDISVVVSDYIMPNMKGDELLERIHQKNPSIRKIMLTGYAALDGIIYAINKAGLYRFIAKPWDKKDLMLTMLEAIKSFEAEKSANRLAVSFKSLYQEYETQYSNNNQKLEATMLAILATIDSRCKPLAGHAVRVKECALSIGTKMQLNKEDMRTLGMSSLLHDIGKIALSEQELVKTITELPSASSKLSLQISEATIRIVEQMLDGEKLSRDVLYQLDAYNGAPPSKLSGDSIPIGSRIISVANTYDVITSVQKRPAVEASSYLVANRGSLFDPMVVNALLGS